MGDLLADGQLEQILSDHAPPPVPFSLLLVPERAGIRRVRLLVDLLVDQARRIPGMGTGQPLRNV